ncbi:hypothetical protein V6N13_008121 [Hibiscus sabdariffa]|uniref:Uncharacterized protein n=1 Tax=Hibiscus sabdariffa TaxID=183260 RepID=A0ABR2EC92_9ROSI
MKARVEGMNNHITISLVKEGQVPTVSSRTVNVSNGHHSVISILEEGENSKERKSGANIVAGGFGYEVNLVEKGSSRVIIAFEVVVSDSDKESQSGEMQSLLAPILDEEIRAALFDIGPLKC